MEEKNEGMFSVEILLHKTENLESRVQEILKSIKVVEKDRNVKCGRLRIKIDENARELF